MCRKTNHIDYKHLEGSGKCLNEKWQPRKHKTAERIKEKPIPMVWQQSQQ